MCSERRRCPECGELADVVLEVAAIGTDLGAEFGSVHATKVNGQGIGSCWELYGHGGRA